MGLENKEFLLNWNSLFPLDHWWRKKYEVSFNSKKHREISYIDIYYEYLEEKIFDDYLNDLGKKAEKEKHYKETGEWFKIEESKESEEKMQDMFDVLDVSLFNQSSEE